MFGPRWEPHAEELRVRVAAFKEKFTQGSVGKWALGAAGKAAPHEGGDQVNGGGNSQQGNQRISVKRQAKLCTSDASKVLPDSDVINNFCALPDPEGMQVAFINQGDDGKWN